MKGLLLVCGGSWLGIKLMKPDLHKTFRSSYSLGRLCWATVTGKPIWRCLSGCVWIKPCGDGLPSWEMEGKQRHPEPVTSRAWCSMSHHEPSWVLDSSSLPMHPFYHTFSLGFRWVTTPISELHLGYRKYPYHLRCSLYGRFLCKLMLGSVIRNAYSHGQIWAFEPCLEEIWTDCFLSSETATFHRDRALKWRKIFMASVQCLLAWLPKTLSCLSIARIIAYIWVHSSDPSVTDFL